MTNPDYTAVITEFGDELAAMPEEERPSVVIFAVQTDGEENSSREYDWPQVREMVERQRDEYGGHILYLGANQDAIRIGGHLGVRASQSMAYANTSRGTRSAMRSVTNTVNTAAAGKTPTFTDKQRKDAV